jgi:hypothetical protein
MQRRPFDQAAYFGQPTESWQVISRWIAEVLPVRTSPVGRRELSPVQYIMFPL